jgi:hypothetical protein
MKHVQDAHGDWQAQDMRNGNTAKQAMETRQCSTGLGGLTSVTTWHGVGWLPSRAVAGAHGMMKIGENPEKAKNILIEGHLEIFSSQPIVFKW